MSVPDAENVHDACPAWRGYRSMCDEEAPGIPRRRAPDVHVRLAVQARRARGLDARRFDSRDGASRMIISCSTVVCPSRRPSSRRTLVRMARKPFWLSLRRHVEAPVDAGRDERAAGEAEEFVESAVQLARIRRAAATRRQDPLHPSNRLDQARHVGNGMGAVGVDKHRNRADDMRDGRSKGVAFAGF